MEWDGYNGGEIASKAATDTVKEYIENHIESARGEKEKIFNMIYKAMEYANNVVYEKSQEDEELLGMGTTMEICLIIEDKLYIGHIGDSRIYRIRRGVMQKLTEDHSYVQELVNEGTITPKEAEHHPKKNMLMKALGCAPFVEPDIIERSIQSGDIIEMNTDGLTNMVPVKEIQETITKESDNIVEELIEKANNAGGLDNITTVIVKI
ncbi:MAG: serine/threonine-protein phosphatase [Clostridia bacterium]|nr:serine/threonine-protein phosphatase [Clostridia bacterium]